MALKLIHVAGQPVAFVTLSLFLCWMCPSTNAEDYYDIIDVDSPELKCSEVTFVLILVCCIFLVWGN